MCLPLIAERSCSTNVLNPLEQHGSINPPVRFQPSPEAAEPLALNESLDLYVHLRLSLGSNGWYFLLGEKRSEVN